VGVAQPAGASGDARDRDQRWLGLVLVTLSAVAYSTSGFFTRLIHLDAWTILFWRGIFAGLLIAAFVVWQHGRRSPAAVRAIGWPGVAAAMCSAFATIMYINAFRHTSVADVMIINATIPFMTAALGWLWLRERERWSTVAASAAALVGAIVMVGGAVAQGRALGDLLAVGMALCMAIMMLIIRRYRNTSMLPAAGASAFLCTLLVSPVASPAAVTPREFVFLVLFGTSQFGLGLMLLTLGTRLVSATESALIGALEAPLGPLWVWLAFAEIPPVATWFGGTIIMGAVFAHIVAGNRTPASHPERGGRWTRALAAVRGEERPPH
jgi:drug/metabolite transporter (DMT)-like permease